MKKTYTKRQILEAITYWQNALKEMNENRQTLLMCLRRKFGDAVDNQHVMLIQTQFEKKMYKILNVFMFDNMLNAIPIKLMSIDDIIEDLHQQDKNNGIQYQDYDDKKESYGFYTNLATIDSNYPENKQIFSLKYDHHMIYLNADLCNGLSFIKQTAVLCHEMIHYFDALYGQYKKQHQLSYLKNRKFDDHSTSTFIKMKRKARKMEIPVSSFIQDDWTGMSDEEFMKAIEKIDESEIRFSLKGLKSTGTVKVGEKCIRFLSSGKL